MSGNAAEINFTPLEARLKRLSFQSDLFNVKEVEEVNKQLQEIRQGYKVIKAEQVLINRKLLTGLPYFDTPKNENELLLNAQYDYLIKGKEKAWGDILQISFEVLYRLVKGYARDNKIYLDEEEIEEKTSKAAYYVLKRFKPEYGSRLPKKRRKNFYTKFPLGQYYVTTNFITFLQQGIKNAFLYTTTIEKNTISIEDLDPRKI